MKRKRLYMLGAFTAAGLLALGSQAYAGDHPANVTLLDANGVDVATSGLPYSPKVTCSTGTPAKFCHGGIASGVGSDNAYATGADAGREYVYEGSWITATKTQFNRDGVKYSYDVPFPLHGVTAGYHFQQGRNIPWDDTQRAFYHVPEYTSSAGMYGKF